MKKPRIQSAGRKKAGRSRLTAKAQEEEAKKLAESFAWNILDDSQVESLCQCETAWDLQEKMADILLFKEHSLELDQACLLDCYVTAFHWAREKGFDQYQISGFITLVWKLLKNIKKHNTTRAENIIYLKECFHGIGYETPEKISSPSSLRFCTLAQSILIARYLISTLFQHYALYEYLLTHRKNEILIGSEFCVEVSPETNGPFPPPLEEAIPADIHEEFVIRRDLMIQALPKNSTEAFAYEVMKAMEAGNQALVRRVSPSQLRFIIGKVLNEMVVPVKDKVRNAIKAKEANYLAMIESANSKRHSRRKK